MIMWDLHENFIVQLYIKPLLRSLEDNLLDYSIGKGYSTNVLPYR